MTEKEDKYAGNDEDMTQVRSIIKRLSEDKPSHERGREVVVRAVGTKVVRVTRKRKVLVSAREKNRRARKRFIYSIAGVFVVLFLLVLFLFMRMASMSNRSYLETCQAELQQSWGATSIQVDGAGVDGTSFHLSHVVMEFPETSMIARVEMDMLESRLDWLSFFRNKIQGEELKMERALVVLREGARMKMPLSQGDDLWQFQRIECQKLTVQFANGEEGPVMLKDAAAYMYYPHASRSSSVVMLSSGSLYIKGWKTVNISESKAHVSARGVDDFTLRGTTDSMTEVAEQRRTSIGFAGSIREGADFTGPYEVHSENMSFSDFTRGRFEEFLTARTCMDSQSLGKGKSTITLAGKDSEPVFNGEFQLRNICLSSFPAMMAITEHIEPAKRRLYNPVSLHRGFVQLQSNEDGISVQLPAASMEERDLIFLRGEIALNAANEMSGELYYGIPMLLARAEYPDGRPDPIFQQNGDWAVLRTRLRGQGNMPGDDMAEVEARAAIARRDRPARIPFNQFDVDKMVERINSPEKNQNPFLTPSEENGMQNPFQQDESLRNPFDTSEDPFTPSAPF
ncbi:MAG: hypothetical protein IIV41_01500 [Akkermansia sp.]|nr:hypothetical protein [Akkermansia sp.]